MKALRTLTTVAAVLALAATSLAQGGGGGRGQGRGMMMMAGPGGSRVMLLTRNDVKADLKLSTEQSASLDKINADAQAEMQNRMEEMRNGGGGFDRDAIRQALQDFQKKQEDKVKAVLTPQQWDRLGQIQIQLAGNRAILQPEVQKALGMTSDQIGKVEALQQNQQAANQDLMQRMRDGELDREQFQQIRAKNDEIMDAELAKILTPDQQAALKKMGGEPFKADPNEANRRRGGG
jgi:hypothetical protein